MGSERGKRRDGGKRGVCVGTMTRSATLGLTAAAMVAFAANSLLCRAALSDPTIDPASFTTVRVLAGAVVVTLLARRSSTGRKGGSWRGGLLLFAYAAPFSFAYLTLSTGTGALILFGAVQVTMVVAGLVSGERPSVARWTGLAMAFGGLVWLVSPGLEAPNPAGAALMALSGIGWGLYSVAGKGVADPLAATAGNFQRAVPAAVVISVLFISKLNLSSTGLLLATVSGAVTSGLGYAIWYKALTGLSRTVAAVVQLSVPIIAAVAGIVVLNEVLTARLVMSSMVVLGGIGLAITSSDNARKRLKSQDFGSP